LASRDLPPAVIIHMPVFTWGGKGGNYGLASFYPGVTVVRGKNGLPQWNRVFLLIGCPFCHFTSALSHQYLNISTFIQHQYSYSTTFKYVSKHTVCFDAFSWMT